MPRKPKEESSPNKVVCTICNEEKPLDEFSPDKRRAIGVTPGCQDCMRDEKIRATYLKTAKEKGIQKLYDLEEKHERNLKILKSVINELTGKKK